MPRLHYSGLSSEKIRLCMRLCGHKCTKYRQAFRNKPSAATFLHCNTGQQSSAPHSATSPEDTPTSYLTFLLVIHSTVPGKREKHIEAGLVFELGREKLLAHKH